MALAAGTQVGPYEVIGVLGAGGMGVVYRARDARLGRTVALKTLPDDFKADQARLQRFDHEARAVAALSHPNILAVFDVGVHEGVPYVVTELLEGSTLREVLAAGALPWRRALEYGAQMAQGLAAAHEKGIVHRDLKPENVFVTREGRLKLLDFGLARSDGAPGLTSTLAQTQSGAVLGTAGYMSPEQVRGQPADTRSDLFSFGVVLYELLTGRRAFDGASSVERGYAVLNSEAPEPAQPLPAAVERVTRRCLEKAPDRRFQSAHDLAFALDALGAASGETSALRAPAPSGRRFGWLGLAVAISLLVGAVASRAVQPGAPAVAGPALAAAPTPALATHFRRLTRDGAEWPVIAPDGTWFAFSRKVRGKYHLFRQRIGGENAVDLTPTSTEDEVAPVISPDGEQIAWQSDQSDGGIFVMGATGESARRVAGFGNEPSWTPDGRLLVSSELVLTPYSRGGKGSLQVVEPGSGAAVRLGDGGVDRTQAVWSPDGRHLAYHSRVNPGWRSVVVEALDGGAPQVVATGTAWTPRWSSDGGALYFGSMLSGVMNLWRVAVGPGGAVGAPVAVTAGVGVSSDHPSLSRDGRLVLFAASRKYSNVARVPFDARTMTVTGPVQVLTHGAHSYWGPDASPDGQWVAFAEGLSGGQEDLVIARADGSERRKLTEDLALDRFPRFTSDSRRVVFYSDRSGPMEIWSVAVDGSDLRKLSEGGREFNFAYPSPIDSRVVAVGFPNGALFDAARPYSQQQVVDLPWPPQDPAFEFYASGWTPDGAEVLGYTEHGGVFAWSPATQQYRRLTSHPLKATTLRHGHLIGRLLRDGRIAVVEVASQRLQVLDVAAAPDGYAQVTVSRDGAWIYFTQNETESDAWLAELPPG